MTPVRDDEAETLALFQSSTAKAFVGRERHLRDLSRAGADSASLASPA
ncbi:MAG TPA: hypothetical protein VK438_15755 [Xanthobacteraceae bacterium]|nr:hypothetical protein [Xanthobacteraceae bacterium]